MAKSRMVQEAIDEADDWELRLPVSMIDVTFLILIFFLCTSNFKTLEQRLDAKLPKKDGQQAIENKVKKVEEIRIKIALRDGDRPSSGVRLVVNSYPVGDLNELARKLAELRRTVSDIPVVIDGRQNVPFHWILGAVDACTRAKIADIKFQAPPVKGGGGDKWWYE